LSAPSVRTSAVLPAADAGAPGALDGVVAQSPGEQAPGGPWPPAGVGGRRRGPQPEGKRHRWSLRGVQGHRHGLLAHRGQGSRGSRFPRAGLSRPGGRRAGGGTPGHEPPVNLDDALFRRESTRLIAALARAFGVNRLALIEDAVQETLTRAYQSWSFSGVPAHHSALLMTSARNRVLDALRHERAVRNLAPELQHR